MQKATIIKPNFSIRAKSSIGLDIGTQSIKVVELHERQGKYVLKKLGIKEIPVPYREENKRDITLIARLIRELFAETGIKNKGVTIAIPGYKVSIKVIKMPQMPKSELREAVKWEMRRHVQFSIEDAVLDYSILGTVMEEGVVKFRLLVAAAPKSAVDEQLAIIKEAGLFAKCIDVVPFALWKAFQGIEKPSSELKTPTEDTGTKSGSERKIVVLVDIGYKRTSINLIVENALQFTRDAKIGGNSFTEALMLLRRFTKPGLTVEGSSITEDLLTTIASGDTQESVFEYDEAEGLKRVYGIPPRDSHERTKENIPISQIYAIMRPVLEKLLVEIERSFDFFASQLYVPKIDKIILSGGGAMLKGMPELLAQGLRMHVEVANPLQDVISEVDDVDDMRLHEVSPNFAVATGLTLTMPERIDLVPEEIRVKRQKIVHGSFFALASFILLLIFAAFYWHVSRQLSAQQKELSEKHSQLSATATPATKLPQLRELREKVKREKTLLPKEPFERYPWKEIMRELSNAVPMKVMLTSLSVGTESSEPLAVKGATEGHEMQSRKLMKLKGIIFDKEPNDRVSLNRFIRSMEMSPIFTNTRLVSTHDATEYEQVGKYFEFVCCPAFFPRENKQEGIASFTRTTDHH